MALRSALSWGTDLEVLEPIVAFDEDDIDEDEWEDEEEWEDDEDWEDEWDEDEEEWEDEDEWEDEEWEDDLEAGHHRRVRSRDWN
ncbi:MAG TPA: hypothetical protein VNZ57_04270 [Longimicrobiales bacterium]|nr:hypothetical protein [Longimicrobiales bacterium]